MNRTVVWLLALFGVHIDVDPDAGLARVREYIRFVLEGPDALDPEPLEDM